MDLFERENLDSTQIPIELGQSPIIDVLNRTDLTTDDIPENSKNRAIVTWKWDETNTPKTKHSEAKLKDKWIKIRIRYKGDKLAIITAIKTLYSASYA